VSCILIGLFLGAAGAFLGIGGGPINLVILYYFFSLDTKNAALTSLYIIFFSQGASLISTFCTGKIPKFSIAILLFMIAGGILGGFAGRFFSVKLTSKNIDRLFIGILLIITGISIYNVIHFAGMSIPA
ncbi:MAG: sulfite exporter TauE/SafE family protein, partial [Oscillospiraceae bacterium]